MNIRGECKLFINKEWLNNQNIQIGSEAIIEGKASLYSIPDQL